MRPDTETLPCPWGYACTRISTVALEDELNQRLTDVAAAVGAVAVFPDMLLSLRPGGYARYAQLVALDREPLVPAGLERRHPRAATPAPPPPRRHPRAATPADLPLRRHLSTCV